jgi:hypothetical protein
VELRHRQHQLLAVQLLSLAVLDIMCLHNQIYFTLVVVLLRLPKF